MVNSIYRVTLNGDHFIQKSLNGSGQAPVYAWMLLLVVIGVNNNKESFVKNKIPDLDSKLKYLLDSGFMVEKNN